MGTLKHTLMTVLLYRLVPEQHVVIIERDGQSDRLGGPGYVKINRISESFGPVIPFGPQKPAEVVLEDVRSADGDSFSLRFTITYSFDPRRCNLQKTPKLVRKAPDIQEKILQNYGRQIARNVVGEYSSPDLRLGRTPEKIEQEIKSRLYREVRFAGIELYNRPFRLG